MWTHKYPQTIKFFIDLISHLVNQFNDLTSQIIYYDNIIFVQIRSMTRSYNIAHIKKHFISITYSGHCSYLRVNSHRRKAKVEGKTFLSCLSSVSMKGKLDFLRTQIYRLFLFWIWKQKFLYSNLQPTDSQSKVIAITPKSQLRVGDSEKLIVTFSHAWLILVEFT